MQPIEHSPSSELRVLGSSRKLRALGTLRKYGNASFRYTWILQREVRVLGTLIFPSLYQVRVLDTKIFFEVRVLGTIRAGSPYFSRVSVTFHMVIHKLIHNMLLLCG